ncbi:unnamed protein product [Polarella glacialis]|uniref:Uncharacterized protein n=1 Tax=Polarella glacialis TaxID=89957 RepID=A0A813K744_POLGL|nr:unnamed protein product [Polarella glacialis]
MRVKQLQCVHVPVFVPYSAGYPDGFDINDACVEHRESTCSVPLQHDSRTTETSATSHGSDKLETEEREPSDHGPDGLLAADVVSTDGFDVDACATTTAELQEVCASTSSIEFKDVIDALLFTIDLLSPDLRKLALHRLQEISSSTSRDPVDLVAPSCSENLLAVCNFVSSLTGNADYSRIKPEHVNKLFKIVRDLAARGIDIWSELGYSSAKALMETIVRINDLPHEQKAQLLSTVFNAGESHDLLVLVQTQ